MGFVVVGSGVVGSDGWTRKRWTVLGKLSKGDNLEKKFSGALWLEGFKGGGPWRYLYGYC